MSRCLPPIVPEDYLCDKLHVGRLPFLSPNQQCLSTEGNPKHLTLASGPTSSFLHPPMDSWGKGRWSLYVGSPTPEPSSDAYYILYILPISEDLRSTQELSMSVHISNIDLMVHCVHDSACMILIYQHSFKTVCFSLLLMSSIHVLQLFVLLRQNHQESTETAQFSVAGHHSRWRLRWASWSLWLCRFIFQSLQKWIVSLSLLALYVIISSWL